MTAQTNIIADLGTATKIPNKILVELIKRENLCIGSAIHDALLEQNDVAVLNIGIGTLSVDLATRQCKFAPSRDLRSAIKKSLEDKVDPLMFELDQAIVNKLLTICDEVL